MTFYPVRGMLWYSTERTRYVSLDPLLTISSSYLHVLDFIPSYSIFARSMSITCPSRSTWDKKVKSNALPII